MKAGIKSGDVIKSVDGKDVATVRDLTRTVAAAQPGSSVKIGLMRDGKDMTVTAKLGDSTPAQQAKTDEQKMPEKASPGSFGFSLAPLSPDPAVFGPAKLELQRIAFAGSGEYRPICNRDDSGVVGRWKHPPGPTPTL